MIRGINSIVSFIEVFVVRYFMAPESVNSFFLLGLPKKCIKAHLSQATNTQYTISLTFNRKKRVACSQTSVSTRSNKQGIFSAHYAPPRQHQLQSRSFQTHSEYTFSITDSASSTRLPQMGKKSIRVENQFRGTLNTCEKKFLKAIFKNSKSSICGGRRIAYILRGNLQAL